MSRPVDYAPLERTPSADDVARLRAEALRGDLGEATARGVAAGRRRAWLVGASVGGALVLIGLLTQLVDSIRTGPGDDTPVAVGFVVLGVVAGTAVWWLVRAAERRAWVATTRLVLFARSNDLGVEPFAGVQRVPGVAGRPGAHAWTRGLVHWQAAGRPAQLATYHWGYNAGGVDCRYLAVDLGAQLPAMSFLCGRPGVWRPETRFGPELLAGSACSLRLGGDEPDARARVLFDDALVALLADPANPTNAEVIDGWFVGYVRRRPRDEVGAWRHAFAVADLVAERAARLT